MNKNRIAVTTTSFSVYDNAPVDLLRKNGLELVINKLDRKLDKHETIGLCKGCRGIIAGTETYDKEVLQALKGLEVISRCGSGCENVDVDSAGALGIKVFNTPAAVTTAVAELTIGLILGLLRKICQADSSIRGDKWAKPMGSLLNGKKVGIVGFGRIGQKVGQLLSAFGAELAYCDIEARQASFRCEKKELRDILGWADIITLHLSFHKLKRPFIGAEELKLMKHGAWLLNLSRGEVVDERALYSSLKDGRLSGAALDVFEQEPYQGPLKGLENVILTPHIGSYAKEARIKMELEASENLLKGLRVQ